MLKCFARRREANLSEIVETTWVQSFSPLSIAHVVCDISVVFTTLKIGTRGVHVSTARESEMCYSLGTSVGDVTRLNVANVARWKFFIVDILLTVLITYTNMTHHEYQGMFDIALLKKTTK